MNVQSIKSEAQNKFEAAKAVATSDKAKQFAKDAGKACAVVAGVGLAIGVASAIADRTYALLS